MTNCRTTARIPKLSEVENPQMVPVQVPLPMLAGLRAVRESFLDLCILAGQEVLNSALEQDRTDLAGPKGRHNSQRRAVRWGQAPSEVTLGGRRIPISRPRVRTVDGEELELPWFAWAADRDPLDEHTLSAIVAGVSSRNYAQTLEPMPTQSQPRAVSKSSVSRRFVAMTTKRLREWQARPLEDLDLRVLMIDGLHFRDHVLLIALGIEADGTKHVVGFREGTTENATMCRSLLRDLIARGLPGDRALLFVVDGGKGIRKAITRCFGRLALVQRCQFHKRCNVLAHLPIARQAHVRRVLNEIYLETENFHTARRRLLQLASSLEADYPGAAASLREGLEETLTLRLLGIRETLYRTLRSTNPIENLNGSVAHHTRNVRRWRNGLMIQRWVAMALNEAEKKFRRIRGFRDMKLLVDALDRHQQELNKETEKAIA